MGESKTGVDVHYSRRYYILLAIMIGSIMGPIDAIIKLLSEMKIERLLNHTVTKKKYAIPDSKISISS